MSEVAHKLCCNNCGQDGQLWITHSSPESWSFAPVGFIGLAVDRFAPSNSVLRCLDCGSTDVAVEEW